MFMKRPPTGGSSGIKTRSVCVRAKNCDCRLVAASKCPLFRCFAHFVACVCVCTMLQEQRYYAATIAVHAIALCASCVAGTYVVTTIGTHCGPVQRSAARFILRIDIGTAFNQSTYGIGRRRTSSNVYGAANWLRSAIKGVEAQVSMVRIAGQRHGFQQTPHRCPSATCRLRLAAASRFVFALLASLCSLATLAASLRAQLAKRCGTCLQTHQPFALLAPA